MIKSQQAQLDKLGLKLDAILSKNKSPASLTTMQSQLRKTNTEIKETEASYNNLINQITQKQVDVDWAKNNGNTTSLKRTTNEMSILDSESIKLATHLENLKDESARLSTEIEKVKLSPQNSEEAKNLRKQIELLSSKLEESKKKANGLKDSLRGEDKMSSIIGNGFGGLKDKASNSSGKVINNLGKKIDGVNKRITQFRKRLMGLLGSALVFNVLSSALRGLMQNLGTALKSNDAFSNSLNQIKANLLTAFAPIYNAVLPAINALMGTLSQITGTIATFVAELFGQTAEQAKNNASALYGQAKAYDQVGKSAKKAEGSTASFDNLEVIGGGDTDTTVASNSNEGIDFSKNIEQSSKLLDFLNEMKSLIQNGDWWDVGKLIATSINKWLYKIDVSAFTNKIDNALQSAVQLFNGFIENLDWSTLGKKVSDFAVNITGSIEKAISSINWEKLGDGINDFIKNFDFATLVSNVIGIFTQSIVGLTKLLTEIDWSMVGQKLSEAIKSGLNKIFEAVQEIDWMALGKSIGDLLVSIDWLGILLDLLNLIMSILGGLIDMIIGLCISIIDGILNIDWADVGKKITEFIYSAFDGLIQWFSDTFGGAWDAIQNVFSSVGDFFTNTVWGGIKSAFSSVTNWFRDTFSRAWQAVKDVFSTGGKIFDGIKDGIANVFKTVINGLIGGINKVIKVPFDGINSALKKIKNIDILGSKPFYGFINTFSVPQIPKLATGAVIPPRAEFMAMLGDQKHGRNLEAPEDLIRQIVREESGNRNQIMNATFIVKCDDIELGKASLKGIRLMESQNGKRYLVN